MLRQPLSPLLRETSETEKHPLFCIIQSAYSKAILRYKEDL